MLYPLVVHLNNEITIIIIMILIFSISNCELKKKTKSLDIYLFSRRYEQAKKVSKMKL